MRRCSQLLICSRMPACVLATRRRCIWPKNTCKQRKTGLSCDDLECTCKPASRITLGPASGRARSAFSPPKSCRSSSCTTLTSCWSGDTPWITLTPSARSCTSTHRSATSDRVIGCRPGPVRALLHGSRRISGSGTDSLVAETPHARTSACQAKTLDVCGLINGDEYYIAINDGVWVGDTWFHAQCTLLHTSK